MLDFYLIKDEEPSPNYPSKKALEYIGGLDHKTFYNLQQKGLLDMRFDYYSDFRLSTKTIRQILEKIENENLGSDSDVMKLIKMLEMANRTSNGIIAYGD